MFSVGSGRTDPADSRKEDGKTKWRITIPGLVAGQTCPITGLEDAGVTSVTADGSGRGFVYVSNGQYAFSVGGFDYEAVVNNAAVVADLLRVGVMIDGVDASALSGNGWEFLLESRVISVTRDSQVRIDCAVTIENLSITNALANLSPIECMSRSLDVSLSGTNELVASSLGIPGIHVTGSGSLTIRDAQPSSLQPSVLNVNGANHAAAIGGGAGEAAGSVAIEGGAVTAQGGYYGAGIGGGNEASGGTIAIRGGTVAATGGTNGAGIGGGRTYDTPGGADGGDVTIEGGTVTATGGFAAAGIGGGLGGPGGRIRILGGSVRAIGHNLSAGIGGSCAPGGTIEISGGTVRASSSSGAGIGGGNDSAGGTITISGGEVTASSSAYGAGIGGGYGGAGGTIAISGGVVKASASDGAGIGGGRDGAGGTIAISGGTVSAVGAGMVCDIGRGVGGSVQEILFSGGSINSAFANVSPAAKNRKGAAVYPVDFLIGTPDVKVEMFVVDDPPLAYGSKDLYTNADGILRAWLPNGRWFIDLKTEGGVQERWIAVVDGENCLATRYAPGSVGFFVNGTDIGEVIGDGWAYDAVRGALMLSGAGPFELSGTLTNATVAIAANCAVTLSNAVVDASAVTNAGAIHLKSGIAATLALMGENAVTGGVGRAGVTVSGGATMSITNGVSVAAQGMGSLSATGGAGAAGIGGDDSAQTGTIRIQGGAITATGGASGAGIGGGSYAGEQSCRIEISGGFVTATAGEGAYAIGAGVRDGAFSSDFGHVAISGGTVRPVHSSALGIGSGADKLTSNMNSMRVTGGSVVVGYGAVDPIAWSHREPAYPVDIDIGRADSPVTADILVDDGNGGTVGYGMNDVRTDANGAVRFWLPEGNSIALIDGRYYQISVGSERSWARPWNSRLTVNGVNISEFSGEGWTFDLATMSVRLTGAGPFEISGEEAGASVTVENSCDVVLRDVSLATGENGLAAFDFAAGVSASLELVGTNVLASGRNQAGLAIAETASLVIRGDGFLSATGGENGAGIGNENGAHGGSLSIEGGVVEAQGGHLAAGIGGSARSSADVTISGGVVTATGGADTAPASATAATGPTPLRVAARSKSPAAS